MWTVLSSPPTSHRCSSPGGRRSKRPLRQTTPRQLAGYRFPDGSMGPKVLAACDFVKRTGRRAVIGAIDQVDAMLAGTAGTQVLPD